MTETGASQPTDTDRLRRALGFHEGHVVMEAEKHGQESGGGCICGFVAFSPEHVAVMVWRDFIEPRVLAALAPVPSRPEAAGCRCEDNDGSFHHENPDGSVTCCVCGEQWTCQGYIDEIVAEGRDEAAQLAALAAPVSSPTDEAAAAAHPLADEFGGGLNADGTHPACGWHYSAHAVSQYGRDCPMGPRGPGASPSAPTGEQ